MVKLFDLVRDPELRAQQREERRRYLEAHPEEARLEMEREAAEAQRELRRRRLDRLRCSEAPARAVELWETGNLRPTTALAAVRDFLDSGCNFLLLSGGAGAGKTVATVEALARRDGVFVHAVDAASIQLYSREGPMEFDRMRRAGLLVLDDLGTEPMHDGWRPQLDRLVDVRYDSRRPTILTTNLAPESFRERYGQRIYDRIRGPEGSVFACGNESLRGKLLAAREEEGTP